MQNKVVANSEPYIKPRMPLKSRQIRQLAESTLQLEQSAGSAARQLKRYETALRLKQYKPTLGCCEDLAHVDTTKHWLQESGRLKLIYFNVAKPSEDKHLVHGRSLVYIFSIMKKSDDTIIGHGYTYKDNNIVFFKNSIHGQEEYSRVKDYCDYTGQGYGTEALPLIMAAGLDPLFPGTDKADIFTVPTELVDYELNSLNKDTLAIRSLVNYETGTREEELSNIQLLLSKNLIVIRNEKLKLYHRMLIKAGFVQTETLDHCWSTNDRFMSALRWQHKADQIKRSLLDRLYRRK